MSEDESEDNSCKGVLPRTNDMTGVDRDSDVAGRGGNDRAVDADGWVWVTKGSVSGWSKVQDYRTYPDPEG
jgi:hypothetical protein